MAARVAGGRRVMKASLKMSLRISMRLHRKEQAAHRGKADAKSVM